MLTIHQVGGMLTNWSTTENETSKVQGFKSGTKDGKTEQFTQKGCSNVEETIIDPANILGWDQIYDRVTRYCAAGSQGTTGHSIQSKQVLGMRRQRKDLNSH